MTQTERNQKIDDAHLAYCKNEPELVPVNENIETVLNFLKKNIKKAEKIMKS